MIGGGAYSGLDQFNFSRAFRKLYGVSPENGTSKTKYIGNDFFVITMAFVLINLIYYEVQGIFSLKVRRMIEKGEITDIIYAE